VVPEAQQTHLHTHVAALLDVASRRREADAAIDRAAAAAAAVVAAEAAGKPAAAKALQDLRLVRRGLRGLPPPLPYARAAGQVAATMMRILCQAAGIRGLYLDIQAKSGGISGVNREEYQV
jgi:hypothetical protein